MINKIKNKNSFRVFATALSMFAVLAFGQISYAAAFPDQNQICTPDNGDTSHSNNISNCVNNIYIFVVGIVGFIAVLMFVQAGYLYITGGSENISKAKEIITATIAALVILFLTYTFLSFIDPNLTNLSLPNLQQVQCNSSSNGSTCALPKICIVNGQQVVLSPQDPGYNSSSCPNGPTNNGNPTPAVGCTNCVSFESVGLNTDGRNVMGDRQLAQRLLTVKNQTLGINWYVTASYEPTGHISACHSNGTCADLGGKGLSESQIASLCGVLQTTGFNITNEFSSSTAIVNACGAYQTFDTTSGPNLHVQ